MLKFKTHTRIFPPILISSHSSRFHHRSDQGENGSMQSGSDEQDCHRLGGANAHLRQSPVAAIARQTQRLARQSAASLRATAHHLTVAAEYATVKGEDDDGSGSRRRQR